MLYNINTGVKIKITDVGLIEDPDDTEPEVSSGYVVWCRRDIPQGLMAYDISTGTTMQLATGSFSGQEYDTSGEGIVWSQGGAVYFDDGLQTVQVPFPSAVTSQVALYGKNILNGDQVALADAIKVTAPVSNELWAKGLTYKIQWESDEVCSDFRILLFKGGTKVRTLKSSTSNDGRWRWKVPNDLALGTDYKIKVVCLANRAVSGFSKAFEVCRIGDLYTPIEVSVPDSNSVWVMGSRYPINWTGGKGLEPDSGTEVKIKLYKGKTAVKTIKASTANDGRAVWTVPYSLPAGTNYRVKVISSDYGYVKGSSQKFEIRIPEIDVTAPLAGKEWKRGYTYPIRWTGGKPTANVKIQLIKPDNKVAKLISASTANDGLFKWKVPFNTPPLSGSYRVRVKYLPDATMRDTSDIFSVINNSPIGTWKGSWTHSKYGATTNVTMVLNNGDVTGSTSQPMAPYGMEGTLALKNKITVNASFVVESIPWPSTEWEPYKHFSDSFVLRR
jgi:5-hydroxyisourate hydrolase-like protein (transthyretin family)